MSSRIRNQRLSAPFEQRRRITMLPHLLLAPAIVLFLLHRAEAQDDNAPQVVPDQGQLIRIPSPISSTVVERAIRQARSFEARARQAGHQPVIIFEIEPANTSLGAARDLAQAITELSATTVAYIPNSASGDPQKLNGHAALVVLACEQIAMSKDSSLGEAGIDDAVIAPSTLATYEEIANARRNVPAAVAKGMLDRALEIWEIEVAGGRRFATTAEADEIEQQEQAIRKQPPVIASGEFGLFTGTQGFNAGFVQHLVESRQALAAALDLPITAMEEDISLSEGWRAVKINLDEPFTPRFVQQIQRSIQRAIDEKDANLIILNIDSPGGAPEASQTLAIFLAKLPEDERRTVAFVNRRANADAAFIAMACDHLLMSPDAKLGGGIPDLPQEDIQLKNEALREVSRETGRSHSVLMAMIDPTLTVYEYQNANDGRSAAFSEIERNSQPVPHVWHQGQPITENNVALTLDADAALRFGIATEIANDSSEIRALYGLDKEPESIQPTWLDTLVNALTQEGVMWALLLIGGSAFFVEMQSPGTGIGGFIACVCFLLFFWGNYLDGTAGWLEILLFIAGLIFLLLEIFVIPGVGIFGLGGGILIVASLVMAMQSITGDFTDRGQLDQLLKSLFIVTSAGVGMVVTFVLLRRYFPKSGRFGSLVLSPPEGDEAETALARESLAIYSHLVGESGTAATDLRPSGKVRIEGTLYDVVSDGQPAEKGEEIVVVKVQGSRIVVRPIPTRSDQA